MIEVLVYTCLYINIKLLLFFIPEMHIECASYKTEKAFKSSTFKGDGMCSIPNPSLIAETGKIIVVLCIWEMGCCFARSNSSFLANF